MSRGLDVMNQAKETMKTKTSGKGFFRKLVIKPEDGDIRVRYRGLLNLPNIQYTETQLYSMTDEDLVSHLVMYAGYYKEDMSREEVIKSILNRYTMKEPIFGASHYIDRNSNRKVTTYMNCGDPASLLDSDKEVECRICIARKNGDKGVGYASRKFAFSFYDYRVQHVVKEGDSTDYQFCTMMTKRFCAHCAYNKKVGENSDTYRKTYDMGIRYLDLTLTAAEALIACEKRVMTYCRSCGYGRLTPSGAYCSNTECMQWFDFDELICDNWDPTEPTARICPHCENNVVPEVSYSCDTCENPISARLYDVDILISITEQNTGKGGKRKLYQFTEQVPINPLDPNDAMGAKILSAQFIDFESDQFTQIPSVEDQLNFVGIMEDPLGKVKIQSPVKAMSPAKKAPPAIGTKEWLTEKPVKPGSSAPKLPTVLPNKGPQKPSLPSPVASKKPQVPSPTTVKKVGISSFKK